MPFMFSSLLLYICLLRPLLFVNVTRQLRIFKYHESNHDEAVLTSVSFSSIQRAVKDHDIPLALLLVSVLVPHSKATLPEQVLELEPREKQYPCVARDMHTRVSATCLRLCSLWCCCCIPAQQVKCIKTGTVYLNDKTE